MYYSDWVAKLSPHAKMIHDKDVYAMQDWVWNTQEDLESFIRNFIDIDETESSIDLAMANRWYAVALLAHELGWEY